MATKPIVTIRNLPKLSQQDEIKGAALNRVSLDIAAREFLTLLGPSDSSNSTLLHTIADIDQPSNGEGFRVHLDRWPHRQTLPCRARLASASDFSVEVRLAAPVGNWRTPEDLELKPFDPELIERIRAKTVLGVQ